MLKKGDFLCMTEGMFEGIEKVQENLRMDSRVLQYARKERCESTGVAEELLGTLLMHYSNNKLPEKQELCDEIMDINHDIWKLKLKDANLELYKRRIRHEIDILKKING